MAANNHAESTLEDMQKRNKSENEHEQNNYFCLNDYDCIGFDMDHTVVQYHLPELFKLIYRSFAKYLIEKKGYDRHLLDEDFIKYEDYSLRGLTFELKTGNFIKLDDTGFILRACHGMTPMSDQDIEEQYGKDRVWKSFAHLKDKVHHGVTYKCFENYFDMPIGVLCARIIDIIDETKGRQTVYDIWPDMVEALNNSFGPKCFVEHRGYFFESVKADPKRYVKKCPKEVIQWLRNLRNSGKVIFLLTQSHVDYTKFLMEYSIGEDWLDIFDFVLTEGSKPNFFLFKPSERPFRNADINGDAEPQDVLERHKCYSQGTAVVLEENAKRLLKKDHIKVVYFGDSPKSDIFPPHKYRKWHTVAILEEMEAEEVHFRKHSDCYLNGKSEKKPRLTNHLLKEEKIIVASKQWGSFFRHDKSDEEEKTNCHEEIINTFWGNVIRDHSKIAIPLLDYLTDLPIEHKFQCFSKTSLGFYPNPPSTVVHDH